MLHLGDITKISGYTVPLVDCVVGGSPCQDLSVAGKRAGLKGERSSLFLEQIRIVKEMRGKDERENGRSGVDIRPRYMVWENVPGVFSSHKGEDFRIVLEETAKIADENAIIPRPDKWQTSGCILGDGWSIAWRVLNAQFYGTPYKPLPQRRRRIALVADFGGQSAPEILFVRKSLSGNIEPGDPPRETVAADAKRSVGTDDSEPIFLESNQNHATVQTNGICTTLTASMGMGGGYVPMVTSCFVDATYAMQAIGDYKNTNVGSAMKARDYKDATDLVVSLSENAGGTRIIVRRLTPLECERLQGYPDGWTDIGDWTDSKGKKRKTSDSARYKALGSSIAIPPWKWIMKRLCACYERDATLASLFDGIGGFPHIWEQLNGKGTCLWASEIEEFPMAVTKVRIGE